MTLAIILGIGLVAGLLAGLLLRQLGALPLWFDAALGLAGGFVAGALGSSALIAGLTYEDSAISAIAAAALVVVAHIGSAVIRPVHPKYRNHDQ